MFAFDQPRSRGHDFRPEIGTLARDQGLIATSIADKVCPVVFRDSSMRQIMAFEHPTAGLQLVKGGIEAGEDARTAALRELEEEAGLSNVSIARDLGTWNAGQGGQVWSLQLCTYLPGLPEGWVHHCIDDGGVDYRFFWHDTHREPGAGWADPFRRVLGVIRERTRPLRWRG